MTYYISASDQNFSLIDCYTFLRISLRSRRPLSSELPSFGELRGDGKEIAAPALLVSSAVFKHIFGPVAASCLPGR